MDNFKYVFFPNPDTGLTMWVKVPLSKAREFDRQIVPLIPKDTSLAEVIPAVPSLVSQEINAGSSPMSDYFPTPPGFEDTLEVNIDSNFSDLGFAWGAFASIVGSVVGAFSKGGSGVGQSYTEWNEFVQRMACNKGKYCYCCCPSGTSGNCYRIEMMPEGYFEMLPRERIGENPRFDCRQLPDFVFKLIPNCGTKAEQGGPGMPPGSGTTPYYSPGGGAGGSEWWSKYGLYVFGGLLVLILVKKK